MKNKNDLDKNLEISRDDFELVQTDAKIFDKKFDTKPTTFFKDAIRRFAKNKSSIAGAIILGILILMAIFVPILSPSEISNPRVEERFLAPKLFKAQTGFWDGSRKYSRIIYDAVNKVPSDFYAPACYNIKVDENPSYVNQATKYGQGGYVMFENESGGSQEAVRYLRSSITTFKSTDNYRVSFTLNEAENVLSSNLGEYAVLLIYTDPTTNNSVSLTLKDWSTQYGTNEINISEALSAQGLNEVVGRLEFSLKTKYDVESQQYVKSYILLENCIFTSNSTETDVVSNLETLSFSDATQMVLLTQSDQGVLPPGYWACNGRKGIYNSQIYYCDFSYDTYAAAYDETSVVYAMSDFSNLKKQGLCDYDESDIKGTFVANEGCPISEIIEVQYNTVTGRPLSITCNAYRWHKFGYDKMPIFILGTDALGHDLFKRAFAGLRTSLILGVCTAAFCLLFGLCWGAISGYFGGNVDLFMERFCEILSGVPWIVIMTLCILHLGNNFMTFFLALCMTGWMGAAGRTRTQFYRFKGREYVLASRTLGASDMRLIFKHILPNSLGTIITSSVLMIPSVIFSEATIAYLGLGLQGIASFGVMMSENQQYLSAYPNLVIFPAVIISLMMICFNLFGNGLRDAVNPSLKGSE